MIRLAAALACLPLAAPAFAAENTQQDRMKACNGKAEGMKGDKRKEFMSACLKGEEPKANKMKECNERSAGKKGEERKAFMSECLKG